METKFSIVEMWFNIDLEEDGSYQGNKNLKSFFYRPRFDEIALTHSCMAATAQQICMRLIKNNNKIKMPQDSDMKNSNTLLVYSYCVNNIIFLIDYSLLFIFANF